MTGSFIARLGLVAFALLAVQVQGAAGQEFNPNGIGPAPVDQPHYRQAYDNMTDAKSRLDFEKGVGTQAQVRQRQEEYDRAVEDYETEVDTYLRRHGTEDDAEDYGSYELARMVAQAAFDKVANTPGASEGQINRARAARDRAIQEAKDKFRERTRPSREKVREYFRNGQPLPQDLEKVMFPPTRTSAVTPDAAGTRTATGAAGTAVAAGTSALGTLGTAGSAMTWGGSTMTPVSYLPDMPAMTLAWDSTLLCTFHPTLPYWFPFTPGGPSLAGGTPTTSGTTPGSTPGGSPGSTPGSTPGGDKLGLDWGGLRYTPGLGGSYWGSKPRDDAGFDWGKIAYLPQDTPKTTTRKEPKTNQPTTPPPIYVNFKATLAAMQAGQSGSVLPGEQIKIFPESTVDPALPSTNTAKNDVGHDGEPMQGTTGGPDNSVTIPFNWTIGAGLKYGLDRYELGGTYNYELKVDPTRTSVIGNGDKGRIADRAFDGFGIDMVAYRTYWGSQKEAEQLVKDAPEDFQINWCRNKEPFAPGTDASMKINPRDALPGAIISFGDAG